MLLMVLILGMTMSAFQAGSHVTDMEPVICHEKKCPKNCLVLAGHCAGVPRCKLQVVFLEEFGVSGGQYLKSA